MRKNGKYATKRIGYEVDVRSTKEDSLNLRLPQKLITKDRAENTLTINEVCDESPKLTKT